MAHSHTHATNRSSYYLDQICTVAACGALGVVCLMMFVSGKVAIILAPQFFLPVMLGGIALLVLVLVRGVSLWQEAGRVQLAAHADHEHHDHHHENGEHCDHQHADCGHDHGHDHAWTPAKYAVLLLPIVLYMVNLPNAGFSASRFRDDLKNQQLDDDGKPVQAKGGSTLTLGFRELNEAAYIESKREQLEGKTVKVKGMFIPLGDKQFTLIRVRMTCCAADAIPMQVRIVSPGPLNGIKEREWVTAEGVLEFRKVTGQKKIVPVITLTDVSGVQPSQPEAEFDIE